MIDFKKKLEEKRAAMTQEERDLTDEFNRIEKENVFYETKTCTVNEKYRSSYDLEPKVYRIVSLCRDENDKKVIEVDEHLRLTFGGFWSYYFDYGFIDRVLSSLEENPENGFYVDLGAEIYIENGEMRRIVAEARDTCEELGVEIVNSELYDR